MIRVAQVSLHTNTMQLAESVGDKSAFIDWAAPLPNRHTEGKPALDFWEMVEVVTQRLGVFINLRLNAGMHNRAFDPPGVLHTPKDAKRRACDKFWTVQLMHVESGRGETHRVQWFFRLNVPYPVLKDKYQLT